MIRRVDPMLAVLVSALVVVPGLFAVFGSEATRTTLLILVWIVLGVLHAVLAAVAWRLACLYRDDDPPSRGSRRLWHCVAVAGFVLAIGDLWQLPHTVHDPLARAAYMGTPFQIGTVLVAIMLLVAGLLSYPTGTELGGGRARLRLDVATVMAGATTFGLLLIQPPGGDPTVRSAVSYGVALLISPGLFLVAVFAVVKMLLGGRSPFTRSAGALAGAAAVAQSVAQSLPERAYEPGSHVGLILAANLVGSMLLPIALRVQERTVRQDPARSARADRRPYSWLPYAAMTATWILTVGVLAGEQLTWRSALVGIGAMVTTALVVTRQAAAFRHIHELLRERDELAEQLTAQAFHDALTGLANRALFMRTLTESLEQGPVTVFLIDLDDFKPVNDSFGHATGDRLLIEVGERLRTCVRDDDLVARLGGDEFAMLVRNLPPERVSSVTSALSAALDGRVRLGEAVVRLRASVGQATGHPGEHDPDTLLHEADMAMYAVKNTARAVRR